MGNSNFDTFTKINITYPTSVASLKIAKSVKSEGDLIISGTKGYIYIPSPWWKTSYFEMRFENPIENKRFFYQLDGEGIRYEIAAFVKSIESNSLDPSIPREVSREICHIMELYNTGSIHYLQ